MSDSATARKPIPMQRRGYRHSEAPGYLGIKRKSFEKHIRPRCNPVRIGTCLIFDQFDLDRAFDEYRAQRNGRPGDEKGDGATWADNKSRVSTGKKGAAGVSIKSSAVTDFATAVAELMKKRKAG